MPDAPTLSLANDETGTSFTATVSSPVTVTLYFRKSSESSWSTGGTSDGDGTITQSGLDHGIYQAIAVAEDDAGTLSLPSDPDSVRVYDPDAQIQPDRGPLKAMENLKETLADCSEWQEWTESVNATEASRHINHFGVEPPQNWKASTAFSLGTVVAPNSDYVFEATTAGTSGDTEPEWGLASEAGDTITDGGITWTARTKQGSPENTAVRLARPFAIIVPPDRYGGEAGMGDGGASVKGSSIQIMIQDDIPSDYSKTVSDSGSWFVRRVSNLLDDMMALAGTPGQSALEKIQITDMQRNDPTDQESQGDFGIAILEATF